MHRLGAHVSIVGGHNRALEKIATIGGNCIQIFSTSPRAWGKATISHETIQQFNHLKQKLNISPLYFHASYLINLANSSKTGRLSVSFLISELHLAYKLGIKGSVVHLGSYKNGDYATLLKNIREVLEKTPKETFFIMENAGTRKIGSDLEEFAKIIKDLKDKRIRVCLDTCHLHAVGYDLRTRQKLDKFLKDFDQEIGLDRLELFHANDSKDLFGSYRDRHENIGEGKVGIETFKLLINHPKTRNLPFIIETPGFDKKGPDKKNLNILKSVIHAL